MKDVDFPTRLIGPRDREGLGKRRFCAPARARAPLVVNRRPGCAANPVPPGARCPRAAATRLCPEAGGD